MKPTFFLPTLTTIQITGQDAISFLHNQLSNDIQSLAPDQACLASYNTPQGRVIANLVVINTGESLLLICSSDLTSTLIKRLKMFVLRSKVVFEETTNWHCAIPETISPLEHFRLPEKPQLRLECQKYTSGYQIVFPHNNQLFICDYRLPENNDAVTEWEKYNIIHGFSWINAENSSTCVAQMLNLDLWGAVSFKKGCYPGQEIIARAHFRGQVKRAPAYYTSTGDRPDIGEKIIDHNRTEVGIVVNCISLENTHHILAVVKYDTLNSTLTTLSGSLLTLCADFDYRQREES